VVLLWVLDQAESQEPFVMLTFVVSGRSIGWMLKRCGFVSGRAKIYTIQGTASVRYQC
jgi:hypothetical protein